MFKQKKILKRNLNKEEGGWKEGRKVINSILGNILIHDFFS